MASLMLPYTFIFQSYCYKVPPCNSPFVHYFPYNVISSHRGDITLIAFLGDFKETFFSEENLILWKVNQQLVYVRKAGTSLSWTSSGFCCLYSGLCYQIDLLTGKCGLSTPGSSLRAHSLPNNSPMMPF